MNFGNKIVILYVSFVSLIVTLVTLCYKQDVELVTKDYYAQELQFQKKIDAMENAKNTNETITHQVNKNGIVLTIDSSLLTSDFKGTVTLFRPSDSKMDVSYPLAFTELEQVIETGNLVRGVYKLQLSWVSSSKSYYKEEVIYIQ
ncbi:MAG: FixH family protein [Bacteroidota bacterium]|jgi:hypothetical protein|nr:FixH family protein [Bacteroidota bacterium]